MKVAYLTLDAEKNTAAFAARMLKAKRTPKGFSIRNPDSYGYLYDTLKRMAEKWNDKMEEVNE